MTYKKYLLNLCTSRGLTKGRLAKKLGVSISYVINAGSEKGIAYNDLNKIIKLLDLSVAESIKLRRLAKFSSPRKKIIIDTKFVASILHEAKDNQYKHIIAATLKFVGVKNKIKCN